MTQVAKVKKGLCDSSPACPARRVCPVDAISQDKSTAKGLMAMLGGGLAYVDEKLCTGCGKCIDYCPMGAIEMVKK
ncbi:MAG: ATP-binding protein [Fusobacteriota bacterium]